MSYHSSTRRLLTALAVLTLPALAILATHQTAQVASSQPTTTPAPTSTLPTEEDSPGWDCHTQGNHVCGPLTASVLPDGSVWVHQADGTGHDVDTDTTFLPTTQTPADYLGALPTCPGVAWDAPSQGLTLLSSAPGQPTQGARAAWLGWDGRCLLALVDVDLG